MFITRLMSFFTACCFSLGVLALENKDILPVDEAFKFSAAAEAADRVGLSWKIAPGYHLYRDKVKAQSQTEGLELGALDLPEGLTEQDAVFGETKVFRGDVAAVLHLASPAGGRQIQVLIKYQGCADVGVCYPPQKKLVELSLPAGGASGEPAGAAASPLQVLKSLSPGGADDLLPPELAFKFQAEVKDAQHILATWTPAPGYFLYKHKLALVADETQSEARLAPFSLPNGEPHDDPEFGLVEIYRSPVTVEVAVSGPASAVTLVAKYQGCAERGVCYPPMQARVVLMRSNGEESQAVNEQEQIVRDLRRQGFGLTLLSFFGFGLLLAFTPCVFPMIPILSGIIVGQGEGLTTRKAFLLSLSYVLASALMYTGFGVLAALFGSNLQAAFQQPWVIGVFSAIFVALSLSMFGFYELELPQSLQNRVLQTSDRHRDGSYFGAAIMGAFSSLIVGPCVAAPLAAALVYIGQTGDVLLGGAALFTMAVGMGAPLLALGASAGKWLPKSGAWLNNTKSVFGVIMLGVAVWMLSRVVPAGVTLLLLSMLLVFPAVYLGALEPLPAAASGLLKLRKGLGVFLLALGLLELIGVAAGGRNPLLPLQGLAGSGGAAAKAEGLRFEKVKNLVELGEALQKAAAEGKPAMLDFYADWCVSCKEMEEFTFSDPEVRRRLADFRLLQADVTANSEQDQALLRQFNLIGPPGIIFFDARGQELAAKRVVGFQDAGNFLKTLQGVGG